MGAAYVVSAWLIIQAVETIFPAFGFGDLVVRWVVIILGIGFLPVLVLTWIFEITPDGIMREQDTDHATALSTRNNKNLDRIIMAVLALALALFAFDKFVLDPARDKSRVEVAREEGRSAALEEDRSDNSVAILPFENLSPDPDNA